MPRTRFPATDAEIDAYIDSLQSEIDRLLAEAVPPPLHDLDPSLPIPIAGGGESKGGVTSGFRLNIRLRPARKDTPR